MANINLETKILMTAKIISDYLTGELVNKTYNDLKNFFKENEFIDNLIYLMYSIVSDNNNNNNICIDYNLYLDLLIKDYPEKEIKIEMARLKLMFTQSYGLITEDIKKKVNYYLNNGCDETELLLIRLKWIINENPKNHIEEIQDIIKKIEQRDQQNEE